MSISCGQGSDDVPVLKAGRRAQLNAQQPEPGGMVGTALPQVTVKRLHIWTWAPARISPAWFTYLDNVA